MKPESAELLEQAGDNIRAADMLIAAQFFEIAVSRSYYAMFYIAEALLLGRRQAFFVSSSSTKRIWTIFAKTAKLDPKFHRYLLEGLRARHLADYVRGTELTEQDAIEATNAAEEFLTAAKQYLSTKTSSENTATE